MSGTWNQLLKQKDKKVQAMDMKSEWIWCFKYVIYKYDRTLDPQTIFIDKLWSS